MNSIVALPIAAAVPVASPEMSASPDANTDRRALEAYASWLLMERRILCGELWPDMGSAAERYDWFDNAGAGWHFRGRGDLAWDEGPQPTSRAAAVLDLVGVDWRQPKRDMGLNHDDTGERPALPAGWPAIDSDLVRASHDIQVIDQALDDLHRKYGDDADSREDYLTLCARRVENIATLIETRSSSMVGVQAKAAAVRLRSIIEDYLRHRQIAVSLAHDLAKDDGETNSPTFEPRQKSPSPDSPQLSGTVTLQNYLTGGIANSRKPGTPF